MGGAVLKFSALGIRRKGDIVHDRLKHQGVNPMRRAFVDGTGHRPLGPIAGSPGAGGLPARLAVAQLQTFQIVQEINGLAQAVKIGAIDTAATTTFGILPEVRDRKAAKAAAQSATLGLVAGAARCTFKILVAKRMLAEGEAEETRERDIVEASSREDSALDDGRD